MSAISYQCKACGSFQQGIIETPTVVICKNCGDFLRLNVPSVGKLSSTKISDDWTFIKIGTTAVIDSEQVAVIGRVRLQLLNDYKNIWTLVSTSGKTYLLIESFGSFSIFAPNWVTYEGTIEKLRAGKTIPLVANSKFHGEYLEKCFGISCEGEIAIWRLFRAGFFVVQCSDPEWNTAFIPFEPQKPVEYLIGKKVTFEDLKFANIITWDEWK